MKGVLRGGGLFLGIGASASAVFLHEIVSPAVAVNQMGISPVRRILVYLPTDAFSTEERFPTVYWLPGWEGWATEEYRDALDRAIRERLLFPVIVVFVDAREGIVFLSSSRFGKWEDFLVDEVVPFVDRTYPTIPSSRYRALMGHSIGGYAAMMLPLLHPGVWGAVGLNDGSVWAASTYVPFWQLPSSLDAYPTLRSTTKVFIQLGNAISPNPNVSLGFDPPWKDEEVSEVVAKWERYSLLNRSNLERHRRTLRGLSAVAVVITEEYLGTNRVQSLEMIRILRELGVRVIELEMPGGHDEYRSERFIALVATVLPTMFLEMSRPVEAEGEMAVLWGRLKAAP